MREWLFWIESNRIRGIWMKHWKLITVGFVISFRYSLSGAILMVVTINHFDHLSYPHWICHGKGEIYVHSLLLAIPNNSPANRPIRMKKIVIQKTFTLICLMVLLRPNAIDNENGFDKNLSRVVWWYFKFSLYFHIVTRKMVLLLSASIKQFYVKFITFKIVCFCHSVVVCHIQLSDDKTHIHDYDNVCEDDAKSLRATIATFCGSVNNSELMAESILY
jgi:hypothetical protein